MLGGNILDLHTVTVPHDSTSKVSEYEATLVNDVRVEFGSHIAGFCRRRTGGLNTVKGALTAYTVDLN